MWVLLEGVHGLGQSGRPGGCGTAIAILPVLGIETDENAGLVLRREARGWDQGIWSCCWGQGEEKEILQDESVDGMRRDKHPYYGERKREEGGGVLRVVVGGRERTVAQTATRGPGAP